MADYFQPYVPPTDRAPPKRLVMQSVVITDESFHDPNAIRVAGVGVEGDDAMGGAYQLLPVVPSLPGRRLVGGSVFLLGGRGGVQMNGDQLRLSRNWLNSKLVCAGCKSIGIFGVGGRGDGRCVAIEVIQRAQPSQPASKTVDWPNTSTPLGTSSIQRYEQQAVFMAIFELENTPAADRLWAEVNAVGRSYKAADWLMKREFGIVPTPIVVEQGREVVPYWSREGVSETSGHPMVEGEATLLGWDGTEQHLPLSGNAVADLYLGWAKNTVEHGPQKALDLVMEGIDKATALPSLPAPAPNFFQDLVDIEGLVKEGEAPDPYKGIVPPAKPITAFEALEPERRKPRTIVVCKHCHKRLTKHSHDGAPAQLVDLDELDALCLLNPVGMPHEILEHEMRITPVVQKRGEMPIKVPKNFAGARPKSLGGKKK